LGFTGSVSVDDGTLLLSGGGSLSNASGIALGSAGVLEVDVSPGVNVQQLSGVEGAVIKLTAGTLNLMCCSSTDLQWPDHKLR
jgi:hypothetical protein